jgi:hypothetical protein
MSPASGWIPRLRTTPAWATTVPPPRGTVTAAEPGALEIFNLSSERTVALLPTRPSRSPRWPAHRSTLEHAYLELTRESVEFRVAEAKP